MNGQCQAHNSSVKLQMCCLILKRQRVCKSAGCSVVVEGPMFTLHNNHHGVVASPVKDQTETLDLKYSFNEITEQFCIRKRVFDAGNVTCSCDDFEAAVAYEAG
jgi:hypothetical protein